MKVESGRSIGSSVAPKRTAGAAPGFSVAAEETSRASVATSVSVVSALDAVLALQTEEPLGQRRARQARRGRDVLDALEELEQGIVSGHARAALRTDLERLRRAAEPTGEPGLDDVLREIDTRAAVELAKLDRLMENA